jgi:cell division protein FtsI (penicillin-binding protein 3)
VSRRRSEGRLLALVGLAAVAFLVVVARAVQVQAIESNGLGQRAELQQREVLPLEARRGTILDRNGRPLAVEEPAKTLVANPHLVKNPLSTAAFLAQELGYHRRAVRRRAMEEIYHRLTAPGLVQSPIRRQLPVEVADRIMAAKLPGITALDEARRTYPLGSLASQLLGYTDIDGHGRPNGAGLEMSLDHWLGGRPGREVVVRDSSGVPLNTVSLRRPQPGRDVRLTIDQSIQSRTQQVLDATVKRWRARSATAIVLDPRSGEILAMAAGPSYDNNRVHDLHDLFERARDRAVEDVYEPGSTFKVVTMSAALSDGTVYPSMKFHHLPYEIKVADRVIHDDAPRGPITLTASQILQRSSNIGTVTIAEMVGKDELVRWIDRYGFGRRTGLGLPGEVPGIVLPAKHWSGSSIGNIPIGQGIGVTAMQMASMYAAIANGGVRVSPHVVKAVSGVELPPPTRRRVLDAHIDRQLVRMLRGVVSDAGTGLLASVRGYSVAGKTGTAQKPDGHGGYSTRNYVASFVGFLPAGNPQVEIMVVVDSPRGNIFGGVVAAPAFAQIGAYAAHALSIKPDLPLD